LQFTAGKRYKLILTNPSNSKHYFTAKDFADSIWSQKVEAGGVEVKGAISELELKPGATAEWVFVPIKFGTYELHCSIPGHAEAGMVGKLGIAASGKAA
ncbi:MAG: sulfocyanin-like copper-binding protein, partial [Leptodesmis sp.]|uniref:sulfocyanin-like copper-binding protein n=1 Tax=Leptodesmis sp. TaxID=3100501 RepID=UPI003D0E9CEE